MEACKHNSCDSHTLTGVITLFPHKMLLDTPHVLRPVYPHTGFEGSILPGTESRRCHLEAAPPVRFELQLQLHRETLR